VRQWNRTNLKPDSIGRGWLHIDPGQCESRLTLTTSVDVDRSKMCDGRVYDQWVVEHYGCRIDEWSVLADLPIYPAAVLDGLSWYVRAPKGATQKSWY